MNDFGESKFTNCRARTYIEHDDVMTCKGFAYYYLFVYAGAFSSQRANDEGLWASSQYKDRISQVWDTHVTDKTVARPSYL